MRSKAHFKSHPIHPILVSFPIVFFIATVLFDILGFTTSNASLALTGGYLNIAGIIAAVFAALPGFIDYLYTVPPESSAKKRAAKHGILNVIVLLIFVIILFLRYNTNTPIYILIAAGFVGVGLLTVAGWLGGTLVFRNQIGVDVRYAGAGKWNEQYFDTKEKKIKVAHTGELELNQMKLLHINDMRIVLARTENGFVAFADRCPHKGGSLAGGSVICGTVQCPWHGSQFDLHTGAVKAGPAEKNIQTYVVSTEGGDVFLEL